MPKSSGKKPKGKAPKVFGSPFDELLAYEQAVDPTLAVPSIVVDTLAYLHSEQVYRTEGIFRLSGKKTKTKKN